MVFKMSMNSKWIDELPEKEKRHFLKLFEEKGISRFCVDVWLEDNPEEELKLWPCVRTFGQLNICPYLANTEPCRF